MFGDAAAPGDVASSGSGEATTTLCPEVRDDTSVRDETSVRDDTSMVVELRKIIAWKKEGMLSDSEFEFAKSKILSEQRWASENLRALISEKREGKQQALHAGDAGGEVATSEASPCALDVVLQAWDFLRDLAKGLAASLLAVHGRGRPPAAAVARRLLAVAGRH